MVEYRTLPEYDGYRFGEDGSVWTCLKRRGLGRVKGGGGLGTTFYKTENWRRLKLIINGDGYPTVNLRKTSGGIKRSLKVSHLVLLAFGFPRPSPRHESCHFPDRNPLNNKISNLRWGTRQENADDASWHAKARKAAKELSL